MAETVKIDSSLLEKVYKVISKGSKRIKYASAKQFINVAVLELLEREEK
jgi:hypothetical protein